MVHNPGQPERKRFTVTLDQIAYERLKALADGHDPPLSMTYAVQYAVKLLLERADDPQFVFVFGDPTRRERSNA